MTDHHKRSVLILTLDAIMISAEVISAILLYILFRGVAWVGWGLDSLGELITTMLLWFYVRGINQDADEHDHSEHIREIWAAKAVAYSFFILAVFGFVWGTLVPEEPSQELVWWPSVLAGFFLVSTLLLGKLKMTQSQGAHDPMRGGGLQSYICVASSFIAGIANFTQSWFPFSQWLGCTLITILMVYAGYVTYRDKRLCDH